MKNLGKNKTGFTLIEMILALSIFVLVMVAAVNVYLIIYNSQQKIVAMQRVQDDVRYLFEAIAQDVRLSRINYSFYDDQPTPIDLHPLAGSNNTVLALIDQSGGEFFYRLKPSGDKDKTQYCKVDGTNDCGMANDSLWADITPVSVSISHLQFRITPSADPFIERDTSGLVDCLAITCANRDLPSYRCGAGNYCRYYSDGHNFQPKVQIVFRAEALNANIPEKSRTLSMQSTISTRIFQGKIQNEHYD